MVSLILAAALVSTNVCSTCHGSGRVDIKCPYCNGKGQFTKVRKGNNYGGSFYFVPCTKCVKGLAGPQQKGTGKITLRCPECLGKKDLGKKKNPR